MLSEHLQRLIRASVGFTGGKEKDAAFNTIKDELVRMTQLAHTRRRKAFIIDCNASRPEASVYKRNTLVKSGTESTSGRRNNSCNLSTACCAFWSTGEWRALSQ